MGTDLQDHPDWTSGDFTLISSDGWRFKVDSFSLCWSRYACPIDNADELVPSSGPPSKLAPATKNRSP